MPQKVVQDPTVSMQPVQQPGVWDDAYQSNADFRGLHNSLTIVIPLGAILGIALNLPFLLWIRALSLPLSAAGLYLTMIAIFGAVTGAGAVIYYRFPSVAMQCALFYCALTFVIFMVQLNPNEMPLFLLSPGPPGLGAGERLPFFIQAFYQLCIGCSIHFFVPCALRLISRRFHFHLAVARVNRLRDLLWWGRGIIPLGSSRIDPIGLCVSFAAILALFFTLYLPAIRTVANDPSAVVIMYFTFTTAHPHGFPNEGRALLTQEFNETISSRPEIREMLDTSVKISSPWDGFFLGNYKPLHKQLTAGGQEAVVTVWTGWQDRMSISRNPPNYGREVRIALRRENGNWRISGVPYSISLEVPSN